jgi:type I restriction enzyme S subunit
MIECVCPPIGEQLEICAVIDWEISKIESLFADSKISIDLLQERRLVLISAAVTGQIDVRGFAS